MTLKIVILAAGLGKRMHSKQPKVLHRVGGLPLLEHVAKTAVSLSPSVQPIIIYGHQGDMLQQALAAYPVKWVLQKEQQGTGHALQQALPEISEDDTVLVLYGDVPLISPETLKKLIAATKANAIGMITAFVEDPTGYGRIIRDNTKSIIRIIEDKDATEQERKINEINTGIYVLPGKLLKKYLPALKNTNQQKEYYLTDVIAQAVQDKIAINTVQPFYTEEIVGVNDRLQLSVLERFHQRQLAETWLRAGVTIMDPARIDIRGEVQIGRDVVIDVNVILQGKVVIGDDCVIGPNTVLSDVTLGDRVAIKANSHIEGAIIASDAQVGPFARIRPGTLLAEKTHIGNFVEIKNSQIGKGSKINHLSYIGDAMIGHSVNIGAGTITCNYDGANKHKTIIHDHVFIGSSTQLIAPVTVGEGATIGAGSTITKDAPAHQLTLSRVTQQTVKDWQRPIKEER